MTEAAAAGTGTAAPGAGAAALAAGTGAAAGTSAAATGNGAAGTGAAPASGGGQGGNDPWYKPHNFDADTVAFIEGKKYPDLATMARSGMESDRVARGRNLLEKPADPKNTKDWKGWSELGWTAKLEDYKLDPSKAKRQGIEYDAGMEERFRQVAHEARVPLPAAQALLDGVIGYQNEFVDRLQSAGAKSKADLETALRNDWGASYGEKSELAIRAAKHYDVPVDDLKTLDAIKGSPGLLKLFAKIGEDLGEDRLKGAGGGGAGASSANPAAELDRLHADPEFMKSLRDQRHPLHKANNAKRDALLEQKARLETGGR